jgi:DNA adenine methylase
MTTTRLTPPLKWHGGKHYLASRIIGLMPPHRNYVEPYAGGLSVLLTKNPDGVSEMANDLNGELTNFWRVLQREDDFNRFKRIIDAVPFSELEWRDAAGEPTGDRVEDAVKFFIGYEHVGQVVGGSHRTLAEATRIVFAVPRRAWDE